MMTSYPFSRWLHCALAVAIFALAGCEQKTPECTSDFDLPFRYEFSSGPNSPEHVFISTTGGPVRLAFTPWGPHALPHSGHPGLDEKVNMQALLWHQGNSTRDMSEISDDGIGNDDGICDSNENCRVSKALILERIPKLVAPVEGLVVSEVYLYREADEGTKWYSDKQWAIESSFCENGIHFGHIAKVGDDLRERMIAQGDPDPETYNGDLRVNLLSKPIILNKGDVVARPQVWATEDLTDSTYLLSRRDSFIREPWAQIETPTRSDAGMVPIFSWLNESIQENFQSVLESTMQQNSTGVYAGYENFRWQWGAEAKLYSTKMANRDDFSDIFSCLGAWMEKGDEGDEGVTFWKIQKETSVFDGSLYHSNDVSVLALKAKRGGRYEQGEVISSTTLSLETGSMLIKWRSAEAEMLEEPIFQPLSYALSATDRTLKINWGNTFSNLERATDAGYPTIPTGLPCDGENVICLDHNFLAGVPGY